MKKFFFRLPPLCGAIVMLSGMFAIVPTGAAQLAREEIASGLSSPIYLTAPAGDTARLFIVERAGRIRIVQTSDNSLLPVDFLNIVDRVDQSGEGGLLSIAFHPNYATNGFFFAYYTTDLDPGAGTQFGTRVSRFSVSGNSDIADEASEVVYLELAQPFDNHNGGQVAFRPGEPANYLYVSLGDGGLGCDPGERSQDTSNKFGTILRLDIDRSPNIDLENPPAPASNPFVGSAGDDLIWVFGLRNPYRFSFDRLTADLYIGDVGQSTLEEISFQFASSEGGENFGWDALEGTDPPPDCGATAPELPGMVPPVYQYNHADRGGWASITGGFVYRGARFPNLRGRYFFADFMSGEVWSLISDGAGATDLRSHEAQLNPTAANIVSFGQDAEGEIYILDFDGNVARIVDLSPPPPPVPFFSAWVAVMAVSLALVGASAVRSRRWLR